MQTFWARLKAPDTATISEEVLSFKYASLGRNPTVTLTNSTSTVDVRVEWEQVSLYTEKHGLHSSW